MASKKKNILYVGGIDNAVNEEILYAAFIPFGELKSVQIPKDFHESKNSQTSN
jgi:peptidyl-prolyl isomerase E (cyclophilin E)